MRLFFFGPRIFGLRTGVSLGREDWAKLNAQPRSTATAIDPDHGFIYVIKGDQGRCKIGITTNPNQRLAQLRSSVSFPIDFAWIGAPESDTVAIERDAHAMLAQYRVNGEWFAVAPDAAVGAISAATFRRGRQLLSVTPERAEQIRLIACQQEQSKPRSAIARVGVAILQLVVGLVVAVGLIIFLFVRLGRI